MPSQLLALPSGSCSISGIAVLENPRQQHDSPRTLLFDAHLFCSVENLDNLDNSCGDAELEGKKGILASLRYFNNRDLSFDDVDAYFITANVVKVVDSDSKDLPNIASSELTNCDYALVGDIVSLIPASMEHACNRLIAHASGYLTAVKSDSQSHTLTFDLAPEQYTSAYKDYNKNLKPGFKKSSCPLHCIIKQSPRWTTMPKLQVGHIVSISGFLSRVRQEGNGKVQFFEVDIEQVNILGKTAVPVAPGQFTDTTTMTPLKRKGLQFDFSQATPSPVKKARRSDTNDLSSPSPQSRA